MEFRIIFYFYRENINAISLKLRFPRFTFFRGLAFRYSIFFLLAILIILFIPLVIGYGTSSVFLILNAQKQATMQTKQTVSQFENILQPTELVPKTLAQALENPKVSTEEILRIARDFVLHDSIVFATCLAFEPFMGAGGNYWDAFYSFEKKNRLTTRMLGGQDYDYFKMDWYRLPKLLNRPVWSEPYYDHGGGDTLMCTYSTPFYKMVGGKRIFAGVLTMDVSLASLSHILEKVVLFNQSYSFLVSKKGLIIASPATRFNNLNVIDAVKSGHGQNALSAVKDMMDGNSGFTSMDGLEAKTRPGFLSYAPVADTGWSFGIYFPEEELLADMYKYLKIIGWVLSISIIILLLTTMFITKRMTRPIVRLVDATRKIGQGDFNAVLPVRKSKDEIAQLTKAFAAMQHELRTYIHDLEETTVAKEKIESELKVAHQIQMGMLPRGFQTPDNWDLFATLDPAKAVGGDLYDFFYLDKDHLCIAIGDVAGKGVPASLFMMVTRTLLRAKATAGLPLDQLMASLNDELCLENPNQMFVTFFIGVVNLTTGVMEFCNAGHNYPYIISSGAKLKQLKVRNGLPLGIFEQTIYSTASYSFNPDEILVITTDGITDALNMKNDLFGEAQLAAALTSLAQKDTKSLTELLIAEVKRFSQGTEQADDITILALQYKNSTSKKMHDTQTYHLTLLNQVAELEKIALKLEELSEQWNIPPKVIMEVNLALEELFTNVVFYAYEDTESHTIQVEFKLFDGNQFQIRLEDDGKPFNLLEKDTDAIALQPLEERGIGGLGIHFIKEMMSRVEYFRSENNNVVLLTKIF